MLTAAIAAARITFETFAMICSSASKTMLCYRHAEDWITLRQLPSHFGLVQSRSRVFHATRLCIECEARRIAANIAKLPKLAQIWLRQGDLAISALPPKADMVGRNSNVRFVPKADMAQRSRYITNAST